MIWKPGMVVHAYNPGTQETEAGGLGRIQGQPELNKILYPKNKNLGFFFYLSKMIGHKIVNKLNTVSHSVSQEIHIPCRFQLSSDRHKYKATCIYIPLSPKSKNTII